MVRSAEIRQLIRQCTSKPGFTGALCAAAISIAFKRPSRCPFRYTDLQRLHRRPLFASGMMLFAGEQRLPISTLRITQLSHLA